MSENLAKKIPSYIDVSNSVLRYDQLESLEPTSFHDIEPRIYTQWYLESCYPQVPFHDEQIILDFLINEAPKVAGAETLLELGCGPVVSHAIPFVPYVKKIILSDFLDSNLDEIRKWIENKQQHFNWSMHTAHILKREGEKADLKAINTREDNLRRIIQTLIRGDLLKRNPIGKKLLFPVVNCFYATAEAANDTDDWIKSLVNLSSLVLPGGRVFLSCIRDSSYYAIHDKDRNAVKIPIARVDKDLMIRGLKIAGFDMKETEIYDQDVKGLSDEGINGVLLVSGVILK